MCDRWATLVSKQGCLCSQEQSLLPSFSLNHHGCTLLCRIARSSRTLVIVGDGSCTVGGIVCLTGSDQRQLNFSVLIVNLERGTTRSPRTTERSRLRLTYVDIVMNISASYWCHRGASRKMNGQPVQLIVKVSSD